MAPSADFLLINIRQDKNWQRLLEETLAPLGNLHIATEKTAMECVWKRNYKAIVVDADVDDISLLISRLRTQQSNSRIIVFTAAPSWKRAREAFQSGAIDYVRKSLNKDELLSSIQMALSKPLPPWPK